MTTFIHIQGAHPMNRLATFSTGSRAWIWICLLLPLLPSESAAAGVYVKRDTWPETMLATRASFAVTEPKAEPTQFDLGPWYTTGQFRAQRFDQAFFPESGVDLTARDAAGQPAWKQGDDWRDGAVHNLPSDGGRGPTYLYRTITVPQATSVTAGFGSDDGLVVWLNGKQLLAKDVPRGPGANQDMVTLDFQQGQNELLLKVFNNSGGHGFFFTLTPSDLPSDPRAVAWQSVERDFPAQAAWMRRYLGGNQHLQWLTTAETTDLERRMLEQAIRAAGGAQTEWRKRLDALSDADCGPADPRWLELCEAMCRFQQSAEELRAIDYEPLRRAVADLSGTYPDRYTQGPQLLKEIAAVQQQAGDVLAALEQGRPEAIRQVTEVVQRFHTLQRRALLANPLLDFDRLLLVRRSADSPKLGLPQNWQGNCALPRSGFDNEIAVLSPLDPRGALTTLYRPEKGVFVGDVDLHFDADRLLFSMPGDNGRFQIWELAADGSGLRQVTPGQHTDVDNYDACYLPDGRIIFDSTRCFQGVPCVGGGNAVANLFLMNPDGSQARQLCFDQDHDWCPTVLNNGRVLYTRWEYTDSPHYFTRLLFHMNPDGTNQAEYYGSNSPWPNSIFYARPVPNHPTKVVAVISGHHGVPRMGELLIFDPARGRHQAEGAIQRIPGYGQQVEPVIGDTIVDKSWPKFLHPYPLSDKYFLVSMQPDAQSLWGIYLVDIFDNLVLIREEPGNVLFEPIPFRTTPKPPVIQDRVDLSVDQAVVYLTDIYQGGGLKGVPRGSVKQLRIYEQHYAYPGMGGHIHIGIDGPWDVHRILGTVPVEADGSASFKLPANTPVAVQPLDEQGRALQIMRSWFTAMPGEIVSCVGCHESQNTATPSKPTVAMLKKPNSISPWRGPPRGFSFRREVQPVLDKHCVGCHDGSQADRPNLTLDRPSPFRNFTPSYCELHPYVRRPGPESDYFMQVPLEYHASVSELVQMLEKGHHGVRLDEEAWDRLVTWIDLNVPDHGSWHEHRDGQRSNQVDRRLEMRRLYANRAEDPEQAAAIEVAAVSFVEPVPNDQPLPEPPSLTGWPFDPAEAARRVEATGLAPELSVNLAEGIQLDLVLIPAGRFVMGDREGAADECLQTVVEIDRPFYMGRFEVTNQQYAAFDPSHDVGYISFYNKDHSSRGEVVSRETQPVIRVAWERAREFCDWLSATTGRQFRLPTEAQWEYACRAGTDTPLAFGSTMDDFGRWANLADQGVNRLTRRDSPPWIPSIDAVDDGATVTQTVGKYQPNAWGLYDMHGNVAEWTGTAYRPYPYDTGDGRDDPAAGGPKVVRGGSFYDRPHRARSGFRQNYQPWQRVFHVGFRVVMDVQAGGG
jgi:formylglycine-generating enzyme required for sulfatase activity